MHEIETIADAVDVLTNPMEVREPYEVWDGNRNRKQLWWKHRMPSLVDQLATAKIPGEVYAEDQGGAVRRMPGSTPPAKIEAINLELALTAWAADNAWRLLRQVRETTTANLRAIVGAKVDSDTNTQLLTELRRWVHRALVIAGWQRPPWRPDVPCPACERRGTLRIRLDIETAICTECGETWDKTTIGILASYVASLTAPKLDSAAQ